MARIKVQHEGKEIEVDLPEGYLSPAQVQEQYVPRSYMEQEISRKAKSRYTKLVEEAKTDPAKKAELAKLLGIEPKQPGEDKGDFTQRLKDAQASWERDNLEPLKTKLTEQGKRVERLTRNKLEGDIIAAAAEAGVKKEFLTPIAEGQPAPFVQFVMGNFGYSDEHDDHFVRRGEEFEYAANPAGGRVPFKTVKEFITKDFVKLPYAKTYIEDQRQRGAGLGGAGGQGGQGNGVFLTREDARNPEKYRAAKAAAEKAGVEVQIESIAGA